MNCKPLLVMCESCSRWKNAAPLVTRLYETNNWVSPSPTRTTSVATAVDACNALPSSPHREQQSTTNLSPSPNNWTANPKTWFIYGYVNSVKEKKRILGAPHKSAAIAQVDIVVASMKRSGKSRRCLCMLRINMKTISPWRTSRLPSWRKFPPKIWDERNFVSSKNIEQFH